VDSDDHVAGVVLKTLQKLEAVKLIERDAE
jgi:hypothetical protein